MIELKKKCIFAMFFSHSSPGAPITLNHIEILAPGQFLHFTATGEENWSGPVSFRFPAAGLAND